MWYKIKRIMVWQNWQEKQVRPVIPPYLCFTANTAGSTILLRKNNSPTSVTLETSTDWTNWDTYTFWTTITLSNIWDKVYFRNTSETDTGFSTNWGFYQFEMTWSIAWSWDITSLLNKNFTNTLSANCFLYLFRSCKALTAAPELPATTLANNCYGNMFQWCSNLTTLPKLPATTIVSSCYWAMFYQCSKIKLSTTQTWEYQTAYRIPTTWTWIASSDSFNYMFDATWWTFTSSPTVNTTYYTSNTVV